MTDPTAIPLVAARYARLAKWVVTETGDVAGDMFDSVDAGTYGADAYASAMGRLFTIGFLGGLGLIDTTITAAALLAGAAPADQRVVESDPIQVAPAADDRDLAVATSLSPGGPSSAIEIALISFDPPTLPAQQTTFKVRVNATDLASGFYVGAARVGPATTGTVVPIQILL